MTPVFPVPAPCSEGRLSPGCRQLWLLPGQCVWAVQGLRCKASFGPVPCSRARTEGKEGEP